MRAQHGRSGSGPLWRRSARSSDERRALPRDERPPVPGRPAVVFGDRVLTYEELDREAGRMAAGLAGAGLRPGSRCASIWRTARSSSSPYYGCQKLGVTPVALNRHVRARGAPLHHRGQRGGRDPERAAVRRPAPEAGETPTVRMRVGTGSQGRSVSRRSLRIRRCGPSSGDREDLAGILYTSATTGRPKGVMLTHANVVSNTHATVHHLRMTPADAGLCALPLFHCFGQNFIMNALVAAGGTMRSCRSASCRRTS